jgi:hypothetical protein
MGDTKFVERRAVNGQQAEDMDGDPLGSPVRRVKVCRYGGIKEMGRSVFLETAWSLPVP